MSKEHFYKHILQYTCWNQIYMPPWNWYDPQEHNYLIYRQHAEAENTAELSSQA